MRRLLFAIVMAGVFLVMIVFLLSNRGDSSLGYEMVFQFRIPYLFSNYSKPIPVGFVLMIAFCLGMITTPILEILPSLYKSLELRSKNKRIRQLERELTLVREMVVTDPELNDETDPGAKDTE